MSNTGSYMEDLANERLEHVLVDSCPRKALSAEGADLFQPLRTEVKVNLTVHL